MVYTERAPRRQQLHVAPVMQQPNSPVSTLLEWILKKNELYIKKLKIKEEEEKTTVTHSEPHATRAQWVCSRAENNAMQKRPTTTRTTISKASIGPTDLGSGKTKNKQTKNKFRNQTTYSNRSMTGNAVTKNILAAYQNVSLIINFWITSPNRKCRRLFSE